MKLIYEIDGQHYEVELSEQTLMSLQKIADRNGISLADAVQQAIVDAEFFEDQEAEGAKLLIEKDDTVREVVRS